MRLTDQQIGTDVLLKQTKGQNGYGGEEDVVEGQIGSVEDCLSGECREECKEHLRCYKGHILQQHNYHIVSLKALRTRLLRDSNAN